MATRQVPGRAYTALHLKQLMDETGGWARSWDDVLRYLQDSGASGTLAMPQLADDVRHLKNDHVHFTTDYRRMWRALTAEDTEALPPPATADENSKASSRVLDVLRRVESKEYREMSRRMTSSGGAAWDNQQL